MLVETIDPTSYRVLVTGDRNWNNLERVVEILSYLPRNTTLIHGYAVGLDTEAHVVGQELGFKVVPVPAHWRHNEPKCVEVWGECLSDCEEVIGRPAGAIRNRKMYDIYHPRAVIGFHENILKSRGTKDMLNYAMDKKCPRVLLVSAFSTWAFPSLPK